MSRLATEERDKAVDLMQELEGIVSDRIGSMDEKQLKKYERERKKVAAVNHRSDASSELREISELAHSSARR